MPGSSSVAYITLTLAMMVTACAKQPTAASNVRMPIAISIGIVRVRSADASYVDATIPLVVINASDEPVFLNPCAPVLERSINGDWQTVFAQMCPLDTSMADIQIPARSERTFEFSVRTPLGSGTGYRWAAPLEGEYRLRTSLRNDREMLPASVGLTSSFRLPVQ